MLHLFLTEEPIRKLEMFEAMAYRGVIAYKTNDYKIVGTIMSIELEDGSGLNFIVKMDTGLKLFVRFTAGGDCERALVLKEATA